jgi:hypothetical protein
MPYIRQHTRIQMAPRSLARTVTRGMGQNTSVTLPYFGTPTDQTAGQLPNLPLGQFSTTTPGISQQVVGTFSPQQLQTLQAAAAGAPNWGQIALWGGLGLFGLVFLKNMMR